MRKIMFAIALTLVGSTPAFAVTIGFNSLVGANGDPYLGHSESGFSVTPTAGEWREAHLFGNPVPDIFGVTPTATVDVTGGLFTFSSVELADAAGGGCTTCATFLVTGFLLGAPQFSFGGTTTSSFVPYANPAPGAIIDTLRITMTQGAATYNIDNIVVTPSAAVPEPATLVLLGSGLVAGAARLRRRRM